MFAIAKLPKYIYVLILRHPRGLRAYFWQHNGIIFLSCTILSRWNFLLVIPDKKKKDDNK